MNRPNVSRLRSAASEAALKAVRFFFAFVVAVAATCLIYGAFRTRFIIHWVLGVKFIGLMGVFFFLVSFAGRLFRLPGFTK